jgi:hypothetical protein
VRITRSDGHIIIRDQAGGHWLLGLFLLAGGLLGVAAPLGLAVDAESLHLWERVASVTIGIGVMAGALWWLRRSPGTRVVIEPARRRLRLIRLGLGGRKVEEFRFDDLRDVAIDRSEDTDGGLVTRPITHLRSGATVHLSLVWSHDHQGVAAAAAEVARACGLPPPTPPDSRHG